jgi:hypothetical protein
MSATTRSKRSHLAIVLVMIVGYSIPFPAASQDEATYRGSTPFQQGLIGAGAVGCSLVYTPVKACYAAGGTVAGGLVFLMSAGQSSTAAGKILERSTRGDWFVHPEHLTGQRRLRFRGSPAIGGGR